MNFRGRCKHLRMTDGDECDNVLQFLSFQPSALIFMTTHQTTAWNETENVVRKKKSLQTEQKAKGAFWHALCVARVLVRVARWKTFPGKALTLCN